MKCISLIAKNGKNDCFMKKKFCKFNKWWRRPPSHLRTFVSNLINCNGHILITEKTFIVRVYGLIMPNPMLNNGTLTDLKNYRYFHKRWASASISLDTECFANLGALNLPMVVQYGLESNFASALADSKNEARFKSGKNWLKNNHLTILI
jgi:hypothetical protein